ncbi:uncharacterized protein DNG_06161 [Cephalotrichum gorgonifer]|uniref:NWD NACHT-NTPase N-terminal domain-containing protein n=1 Tax=Cephalotrichum gorgonifer TaxID=2041049 RepID=A0AAE8SW99_9PEZI|nr:uncharacterized protein DNG_06161 [Cephalotrichum gorgonifer]
MGRFSKFKDLLRRKKPPSGGSGVSSPSASLAGSIAAHPTSSSPSSSAPLEVLESPDSPHTSPALKTSVIASLVPDASTVDLSASETSTPLIPSDAVLAPTSSQDDNDSINSNVDPWKRAYQILQERENELLADYTRHLASLQGETSAAADLDTPFLETPRSVESIVERLLENRDKKQWRISLLGKEIKIREQTERLAKFFLWSDPVIKNALSAQPYAALAWSGVSLLLPLLTSGTVKNAAMLQGFNQMCHRQMYWKICEDDYLKPENQEHYLRLVEPLAKLYSYVLEYQARVICHLSKAQLSRAWEDIADSDAWQVTEFERLDQECEGYVGHLHKQEIRACWNGQLQEMQKSRGLLCEISSALEEIREQTRTNYTEKMQRELLHSLASDYNGYKDFNPKKVAGTCEWFFNDSRFHTWRDGDTSRLLWVSADPGCGKSVLSRALVDEHRLSTYVTTSTICHFFFKDGDTSRMSSSDALRAILHQLFTQDRTGRLIECALPSYKTGMLDKSFSTMWKVLVECAESPGAGEIVCILDALDECRDGRNELFENLRDFYLASNSPSKLKFLITSRPYDYLERPFKVFLEACEVYLRFDGNEKSGHIREEINLVIDDRLPAITSGFTEEHRSQIRERLRSMEHRTYLWLHLTFSIIEESPYEYGRLVDLQRLLDSLPSKVSEAYERILSRSKGKKETKVLLQIVLAAQQPLRLEEANIALTVALQKPRFESVSLLNSQLWPEGSFEGVVKNLCGLFISIYDGKLYFIHQTAREFLTKANPDRQGTWGGRLNMLESHSTMSLICLDYLLLPDLEADIKFEQHGPSIDYLLLTGLQTDNKFVQHGSFINYAVTHWPFHYSSQEEKTANESRKRARLLCPFTGSRTPLPMLARFYSEEFLNHPHDELYLASALGLNLVVEDILAEDKAGTSGRDRVSLSEALWAAAGKGNKETVRMLLHNGGADVNWKDQSGNTPLSHAAENRHEAIVQLLLEEGADIESKCDFVGQTPLSRATRNGYEAIFRLLLKKGADIEAKDHFGRTPLAHAARWGNEATVRLLLEEGADIESKCDSGRTPLSYASSHRGGEATLQLLLDEGAGIESKDNFGKTPLSHASSYPGNEGTVQLLLKEGADIESKDSIGTTPLLYASFLPRNEATVQLLLREGADIEWKDKDGRTPLSWVSSSRGNEATVYLLLKEGADIDSMDNLGHTPLWWASKCKEEDIILLLLREGADIESKDGGGRTVLSHVVQWRWDVAPILQLLLKEGADIESKDNFGHTPLWWASKYNRGDTIQLLLREGADIKSKDEP